MQLSRSVFLPLLAVSLSNLVMNVAPAKAASIFNFKSDYDFSTTLTNFPEIDLIRAPGEGRTNNAPLALNRFESVVYIRLSDFSSALQAGGVVRVESDPGALGLPGNPEFTTFFGEGNDKLFISFSGINTINPQTSTNSITTNINIVGGEGRFRGAKGTGFASGSISANPDSQVSRGKLSYQLSIITPQSVPEPKNVSGLSLAVLSASLLLKKSAKVNKKLVSKSNNF